HFVFTAPFLLIPLPVLSPYTTHSRSPLGAIALLRLEAAAEVEHPLGAAVPLHAGQQVPGPGVPAAAEQGARARRRVGERVALLRSVEHTSELQSREKLVCRFLLAKKI